MFLLKFYYCKFLSKIAFYFGWHFHLNPTSPHLKIGEVLPSYFYVI